MAIFDVMAYGAGGANATDDTAAIQSALDALAAAGGGTLLFPEGTYRISNSLEIKPPGNILISAYGATIIRAGYAPGWMYGLIQNFIPAGSTGETTYYGYNGPKNITFEGGVWDVNGRSGGTLIKCNGINIGHSANVTIRDVKVLDTVGWHAIEINSTDGALIENCKFEGFNDDNGTRQYSAAVQLDFPGQYTMATQAYDNYTCRNVQVTGCSVTPSASNGCFGRFVESHSSVAGHSHEDIRITNNYGRGLMEYAIQAQCWRNVIISGNIFEGCNGGVKIEIPEGMTVFGDKIPTQNLVVSNNIFENMGVLNGYTAGVTYGVISVYGLNDTTLTVKNVNIANNVIRTYANSNGIYVNKAYAAKVTGNQISENTSSGQGYGHGIVCDTSYNNSVIDNTVVTVNDNGIILRNTSGYSQISNNMVHWAGGSGVYVYNSPYTLINGNHLANNGRFYGNGGGAWGSVYVDGTSVNCTVTSNNFVKGSSPTANNYGLAVGTGATIHWTGNHFQGWSQANSMNGSGTAYPNNTNGFNTTYYPNRWV